MKTKIRNEPLRLVLSDKERAFIRRQLRAAKRQCAVWLVVAGLSGGAVLVGLYRHDQVPIEIQIDKALAKTDQEVPDSSGAAACGGDYHVYAGTRRTVSFCDEGFQHAMFRARLKAVADAKGFWPDLNRLLAIVGSLALLASLIGIAAAIRTVRKYVKYGGDLDAFLRRFNRTG